ncbi:MAG TPA: glycosyltransferase [Solirubrobacteraceae bacterium]|nr:glycosyltransferase [Solirubrobacteraceae bacterium]
MAGGTARVGVIVPVHGWAPYLTETLDGVLGEEPGAVVVVDDGSDPPVELDPDQAGACRLVRLERRRGLAGARAAGLAELETELVALCDGDDVWEAGSLGLRVAALGEAAACFARSVIVGPDGRPTGERWEVPDRLELPELYERNPLCVSGVVLRRAAVVGAGGLECDLRRCEDWDLWLRLLGRGERLVYEPRAVVRYRRRAGALSGDIAGLAGDQLVVHARHAGLVSDVCARRVRSADLRALAAGLVRERRYREARAALREAGAGGSATSVSLAVPGLRGLRGRRDPYRG